MLVSATWICFFSSRNIMRRSAHAHVSFNSEMRFLSLSNSNAFIGMGNIQRVYKTLGTPSLSMTDWPGESRWKLWSLVDVTWKIHFHQCRWRGGEIKPSDNWDIDCVWVLFRRWMGKTKRFRYLWTRYGSTGSTGLSVSRTAMLLGLWHSLVSCVYQELSNNQRTSSQLDICGRHLSQNGPASLWNAFDTL